MERGARVRWESSAPVLQYGYLPENLAELVGCGLTIDRLVVNLESRKEDGDGDGT